MMKKGLGIRIALLPVSPLGQGDAIMKTSILAAILLLAFSAMTISAQTPIVLKPGQQRTVSGLKIKFISVEEDSRCPENARCVWAGNARVKIEVTSKRLGTKVFEMNTFSGPKGNQLDGYAINLEGLSPGRKTSDPIRPSSYRATISVSRLKR
jgi:hypothetical protein